MANTAQYRFYNEPSLEFSQNLIGLQANAEYSFSIDFAPLIDTSFFLAGVPFQMNCTMYMFHDSYSAENRFASFSKVSKNGDPMEWNTYTGMYTPTSSSMVFGVHLSCDPFLLTPIVDIYFDNARAVGESFFSENESLNPCLISKLFCFHSQYPVL